jgi:nitrite reductase/ring-hydroxylating ferredoxin subunit
MVTHKDAIALLAADVAPGTCRKAYINGQEINIYNVDGQIYATQSACTHEGGPLCEGELAGDVVTCPWHGSQFNVRTGEVVMDPAKRPLVTYAVTVTDGIVTVEL